MCRIHAPGTATSRLRPGACTRLCLIVWIAVVAGAARANEPTPEFVPFPTLVRLTEHAKASLRLIEIHRTRGHMDGAEALRNYTVVRPAVRLPFAKWGEVDIATRYDNKRYEFAGESDLVDGVESAGTPFEDLHSFRVRMGTNMRSRERTFWSLGAFARAKWEDGADLSQATRVGGFAAFAMQIDPRLFIGLGVALRAQYHGGHERVAPIWRVQWQLTERWQLRIDNARARLRFKPNPHWRFEIISGYSERVYRLRDRGAAAASKIEERSIPLYTTLMWNYSRRTRVEFNLGTLLDQRLQTNAGGRKQSIDQGVAVYLGFGLRFHN